MNTPRVETPPRNVVQGTIPAASSTGDTLSGRSRARLQANEPYLKPGERGRAECYAKAQLFYIREQLAHAQISNELNSTGQATIDLCLTGEKGNEKIANLSYTAYFQPGAHASRMVAASLLEQAFNENPQLRAQGLRAEVLDYHDDALLRENYGGSKIMVEARVMISRTASATIT